MEIEIKNFGKTKIEHIILDNNGTISLDGEIIDGVRDRFNKLTATGLKIHVVTGDIHGDANDRLSDFPCKVHVISGANEAQEKLDFITSLGCDNVIAIGNGSNDSLMLKGAFVGIAVLGDEGLSMSALKNADIVAKSITNALDLIVNEKRLIGALKI